MLRIHETIHHGSYRAERDVDFDAETLLPSHVLDLLRSCSYISNDSPDVVAHVRDALIETGEASRGWVRWTMTTIAPPTAEIPPTYVKSGIAGYGPELDTDDVALTTVRDLCMSIREELDSWGDILADTWAFARDSGDAEAYMANRELADRIEHLRANLDYDRRAEAPLYANALASLDETMTTTIAMHFPLTLDVGDTRRLYVWEA